MEPLSLPTPKNTISFVVDEQGECAENGEEQNETVHGAWSYPHYDDMIVRRTLIKVFELVYPRFQPWYRLKLCTIHNHGVHGVFQNRVSGGQMSFVLSMQAIAEYFAQFGMLE